jgi:thiol:disulfide interchange protein
LGVFFMALTLALVSFSCTGPILGSLLAGSLTADGGAWQLTAGMGGFGLALGLPFALFAMFPNMMHALPKSGGWLNTTKVVLGFLELALAFKFLSNADLVKHWGLLKIEVFLGLWIIIFTGLALYIFGKIKFPHDSPLKKLSFFRIASGILVAAFVIYLASGFRVNKETNTFTPLTLLSGLAPPVGYSMLFPNDCPNNLECFKDLKEGIAYAKKTNKPIMLDFTGYACVNCRKMEEHVWPKKKIDNLLRNNYVLISLYVDDKKALPENEQILVNRINGGTRKLENYGHKWAHFQTQFFQTNSQPYYVLLSPDGNQILKAPVGYTPNEDDYAQFLQCGLDVLQQNQ